MDASLDDSCEKIQTDCNGWDKNNVMEKRTSQLKRVKIPLYVRQSPLEHFISFEMTYGALRNNNLRFPFNDYDNVRHTTEQFYTPT